MSLGNGTCLVCNLYADVEDGMLAAMLCSNCSSALGSRLASSAGSRFSIVQACFGAANIRSAVWREQHTLRKIHRLRELLSLAKLREVAYDVSAF